MNGYIALLISVCVGYLLGSIPFALVIGKVFYQTDVRNFGSKNLGGGNTGRVLGKKAGVAVMTMDILKVVLAIFIASLFENASLFEDGNLILIAAGLAAAVGHCFPVFAGFKGGKAVAAMYGFWLGMAVFAGFSYWIFLLPLITFLIILYMWKIIALASIFSAVLNTVFIFFTADSMPLFAASVIFTIVVIIRHKKNIERILRKEENKISWM